MKVKASLLSPPDRNNPLSYACVSTNSPQATGSRDRVAVFGEWWSDARVMD